MVTTFFLLLVLASVIDGAASSVYRCPDTCRTVSGNERFVVGQRPWIETATDGTDVGARGDPLTLTYGVVPDGTIVGAEPSSWHARMDELFDDETTWRRIVDEAFASWSDVCGVRFVPEVADDGAPWGTPGELDVRPDVRLFMIDIAHGGIAPSDILLGLVQNWNYELCDYGFFHNVLAHEIGHVLGLRHSDPETREKLMERSIDECAYRGPTDDDTRGAQTLYGDPQESDDAPGSATAVPPVAGPYEVRGVSIDRGTDDDWYSFVLASSEMVAIDLVPVGGTYLTYPQVETEWPIDVVVAQGAVYTLTLHADVVASEWIDGHLVRFAELPGHAVSVAGVDGALYVAEAAHIDVYDTAEAPDYEWSSAVSADEPLALHAADGLLIAAGDVDVHLYDIADPLSPTYLASVAPGSMVEHREADRRGDMAFFAMRRGLKIVDVSNVCAPIVVAELDVGWVKAFAVVDGAVFFLTTAGIVAVDVADPASPIVRGSLSLLHGQDVAIVGETVYVARRPTSDASELIAIDATDLDALVESPISWGGDPPNNVWSVAPSDGRLVCGVDGPSLVVVEPSGDGGLVPVADSRLVDTTAVQDLRIEIRDAPGVGILAVADAGGVGEAESIPPLPLASGEYTIRVSGSRGPIQRYDLDIDIEPPSLVAIDDLEPSSLDDPRRATFQPPRSVPVDVTVFAVDGRLIHRTGVRVIDGEAEFRWDGRSRRERRVGSGVYFVRATQDEWVRTTRMIVR